MPKSKDSNAAAPKKTAHAEREARLARALRENLKRRKDQDRGRADTVDTKIPAKDHS